MKKILAIILCLTVCLTVYVGCDKSAESKQEPPSESASTTASTQEPSSEPASTTASTQELSSEPASTTASTQQPSSEPASGAAQQPSSEPAPEPTKVLLSEPTTAPAPAPTLEPEPEPVSIAGSVFAPLYVGYAFTEDNFSRIDGSTATIPLIEAVTAALLGRPRSEISVTVSKTNEAYVALFDNYADILLVYDGGDETRQRLNADVLFETAPIGKDALVFLVNRDNPIENLTTQQVQKIFSGEYTNWSELGGSDEPIRAYQRGVGSGSQALMDKLVMPGLTMADPAMVKVIESMGGLIDAVADFGGEPTGIGYNVYFMSRRCAAMTISKYYPSMA